jgi:hypothetical protein
VGDEQHMPAPKFALATVILELSVPPEWVASGGRGQLIAELERIFNAQVDNAIQVGPGASVLHGVFTQVEAGRLLEPYFDRLRKEYPLALPTTHETPVVDTDEPEPFRGLSHIVDVWRWMNPDARARIRESCPKLGLILDHADRYMREVEGSETVNEVESLSPSSARVVEAVRKVEAKWKAGTDGK